MISLNKVFLVGKLARDPDLRYTPAGTPVTEFRLAVQDTYYTSNGERRGRTCFVDVVCWRRLAESCGNFLVRGSPVFVEGRLELDSWETAEGVKRNRIRVMAYTVQFIRQGEDREGEGKMGVINGEVISDVTKSGRFAPLPNDEDIRIGDRRDLDLDDFDEY